MGEAPPYTREELTRLLRGVELLGVSSFDSHGNVVFIGKKGERTIEIEVDSIPEWPGSSDRAETKDIYVEQTVYVRGIELEDVE